MDNGGLAERLPTTLAAQLGDKIHNADWVMANFAFMANVTALVDECDLAVSPAMSVASCHMIPHDVTSADVTSAFALSFMGQSPELLANYAAFLIDVGTDIELLVNAAQRKIVEDALDVLAVQEYGQYVFRAEVEPYEAAQVARLGPKDLPAMHDLAKAEKQPFPPTGLDPFTQGPAFGVWERRRLVAMAMTVVHLPATAQIGGGKNGSFIFRRRTSSFHEYQEYGAQVVFTLAQTLLRENIRPFMLLPQKDIEDEVLGDDIALLEMLGFAREHPMYLMHCMLKGTKGTTTPDERTNQDIGVKN